MTSQIATNQIVFVSNKQDANLYPTNSVSKFTNVFASQVVTTSNSTIELRKILLYSLGQTTEPFSVSCDLLLDNKSGSHGTGYGPQFGIYLADTKKSHNYSSIVDNYPVSFPLKPGLFNTIAIALHSVNENEPYFTNLKIIDIILELHLKGCS